MISIGDFVDKYDALMLNPSMAGIYGDGDYFNVGYWHADTQDQRVACENLITRLLSDVPVTCNRVLDVGCGCGGTTASVKRYLPHATITGINLSDNQLRRCRLNAPECSFVRMDAAYLAFPDNYFDCVFSVEAAFHFHTRERFLREASRVLKSGGSLVLSDILFANTRWVGDWMVPVENRATTLDSYNLLLKSVGFEEIRFVDATIATWHSFCLARLKSAREQFSVAAIDVAAFESLIRYFGGLLNDSLGQYLLIVAQKKKNSTSETSGRTVTNRRSCR